MPDFIASLFPVSRDACPQLLARKDAHFRKMRCREQQAEAVDTLPALSRDYPDRKFAETCALWSGLLISSRTKLVLCRDLGPLS